VSGSGVLYVRRLGLRDYQDVFEKMQQYTDLRSSESRDEVWLLEHHPVYTQGRAGKKEHVLNPGEIPVVQADRGGQVTYHGPGQLIAYFLIDLRRKKLGIRQVVSAMENAVIDLLNEYGLTGQADPKAPGVYIDGKKISALGLRVRRGSSYHGLSLNLNMDLAPFSGINPCGYQGLEVVQLGDFCKFDRQELETSLIEKLKHRLGYNRIENISHNHLELTI